MSVHRIIGNFVQSLIHIVISFLIFSTTIYAGVTGKISGKLTLSSTGESIHGATIQIVGTNFGSVSNQTGRFTILNLPPDKYSVKISFIGLETIQLEAVQVTADLTTWLNLQMKSALLEGHEVIVHPPDDIIEKDLAGTRAVVTQEHFDALPISKMADALGLQAGVVRDGNELNIRGGRPAQVAYLIDGVYVQDPFLGSFSYDLGSNSIQELTLLSGTFNAEYGNAMSGIVNIVIREGGRDWGVRLESRTGIFQNEMGIATVCHRNDPLWAWD